MSIARPLLAPAHRPSAEEFIQLAGNFHTIKGGAGFFGLNQVMSLAADLEQGFLNGAQSNLAELRRIFLELEEAAGKMPAPGGK